MSMKNSDDIIWNGTRDLLGCSAVPQPTINDDDDDDDDDDNEL
jgi:hypothetical protein